MAQRISDASPDTATPSQSNLDYTEQLKEARLRERQMEKTIKWWMTCALDWKKKWTLVHREREMNKMLLKNAERQLTEITEHVRYINCLMCVGPENFEKIKPEILKLHSKLSSRSQSKPKINPPQTKSADFTSPGQPKQSELSVDFEYQLDDAETCSSLPSSASNKAFRPEQLMEYLQIIDEETNQIVKNSSSDPQMNKSPQMGNNRLDAENSALRSTVTHLCHELVAAQDEIDKVSEQIANLNKRNKELLDLRESRLTTLERLNTNQLGNHFEDVQEKDLGIV